MPLYRWVLQVEFTIFGLLKGGDKTRSDYVYKATFDHILSVLTPQNRLAIETSLTTGLRISDVLSLKTEDVRQSDRLTVIESKTGKKKRIYLSNALRDALLRFSGKIYIFPHRLDYRRHRTRQAVYKDIKRACKAFRIKNLQISPHSARKIFAVSQFQKYQDINRVKKLLNHDDEAVTMIYAMADTITEKRK